MITRLSLRHFQKWHSLDLDLGQVTVLCGRTDSGKSSALRSLRWLCLNRPAGDGFVRRGADGCTVSASIDGRQVERERGKGVNEYRLGEESYKALRQGVPDVIRGLLNIDPSQFQGQHDPPFWLSLPPGQVAQELNHIVNLDLIDRTLRNLAAESRRTASAVEVCRGRLRAAKQRREELAWVPGADAQLQRIEQLYERIQEKCVRLALARRSLEGVGEARERLDRLANARLALLRACAAGDTLAATQQRLHRLQDLVNGVNRVRKAICQSEKQLGEVRGKLAAVKQCPACGRPL